MTTFIVIFFVVAACSKDAFQRRDRCAEKITFSSAPAPRRARNCNRASHSDVTRNSGITEGSLSEKFRKRHPNGDKEQLHRRYQHNDSVLKKNGSRILHGRGWSKSLFKVPSNAVDVIIHRKWRKKEKPMTWRDANEARQRRRGVFYSMKKEKEIGALAGARR